MPRDGNTRTRNPNTASFKIIGGAFYTYYIRDFDLVEGSTKGISSYIAPFWNWLFCKMGPIWLGIKNVKRVQVIGTA